MSHEYPQNVLFFEARKAPVATVLFGKRGESIPVLKQRTSIDCGQTALEMLGYDGHNLFKGGEVTTHEVAELIGLDWARNTFILGGEEAGMDYSEPHLVLLRKSTENTERNHWVIRLNDTIICPSGGVADAKEYMEKNSYSPSIAFKLPFISGSVAQLVA